MNKSDSDRKYPKKKFIQGSQDGTKTQKTVFHNTQPQVPTKIEYKYSKNKISSAKSRNSQGTKKSLEYQNSHGNQGMASHFWTPDDHEVSQITLKLEEDNENNDQKDSSIPASLLIPTHCDDEGRSGYYDKWDELIEMERQVNAVNEKVEIRLTVIFHSASDDENNLFIFYKKFEDKKKCDDFYIKAQNMEKNIKIISFSGHKDQHEEHELAFYEPQGIIKEIKAAYHQDKWICILYITSQHSLTNQLKFNSRCEILEQKIDLFNQMKFNVTKLCEDSPEKFDLIGALHPPIFSNNSSLRQFWPFYKDQLNPDQQIALEKCLKAEDYSIIHGLPGTGKSYMIVILLRILIERGEKVLLSSHTSFAIDKILERFVHDYPNLSSKIARKESLSPSRKNSLTEEENDLETPQVFALTCQAVFYANLQRIKFDTCIIDEATYSLEPVILGPLLLAKRFILFGDHFQLQPLVKSKEAKEKGMSISLFERLARAHRSAVSTLKIQYRMNQGIMTFSNTLVYGNCMNCASEKVKAGRLKLTLNKDDKWVEETLAPNKPVVFLNLVKCDSMAKLDCKLASHLVHKLVSSGMSPQDIGVISPLNSDVDLIKANLNEKKISTEVFSLDCCQGMEKQCIIINFFGDKQRTKDVLSDWKRINIAFTRAKHKLIMIGSITELKTIDNIKEYMHLVETNSSIINVTSDNLKLCKD